jgi:hypothetical protein
VWSIYLFRSAIPKKSETLKAWSSRKYGNVNKRALYSLPPMGSVQFWILPFLLLTRAEYYFLLDPVTTYATMTFWISNDPHWCLIIYLKSELGPEADYHKNAYKNITVIRYILVQFSFPRKFYVLHVLTRSMLNIIGPSFIFLRCRSTYKQQWELRFLPLLDKRVFIGVWFSVGVLLIWFFIKILLDLDRDYYFNLI